MFTIIAIGKKHEDWIEPGLKRYEKRLQRPFDAKWILLPHSPAQGLRARQEESEHIMSRLSPADHVILLDEAGRQRSSPELAADCEARFNSGKKVVFIIGGAYGVDETLRQRADVVWSLGKLVFPHQLVRLLLIEQLYRAQEITRGSQYHHA